MRHVKLVALRFSGAVLLSFFAGNAHAISPFLTNSGRISDVASPRHADAIWSLEEKDRDHPASILKQDVAIYTRPPNKNYDFRACPTDPRDPAYALCRATGVIKCDGFEIGTATLLNVEGRVHDVFVTAAHNFVYEDDAPFEDCVFHPGGPDAEGVKIIHRFLHNPTPNTPDRLGTIGKNDRAFGLLDKPVTHVTGAVEYVSLTDRMLNSAVANGARFFQVGFHPEFREIRVSDDCRPYVATDANYHDRFAHSCNTVGKFSGGAQFMVDKDGKGRVFCVHKSAPHGYDNSNPQDFYLLRNPNDCVKLSRPFVKEMERAARAGTFSK
jgi:hypothetical protein